MNETLEFGFRDLFNWGKKAAGWIGRTAGKVARRIIKIPDHIKRLIKAVILKRNEAIRRYQRLRRVNPQYAARYYRKLQVLEREYKYLIKGNSQISGLEGWPLVIIAGVAIGGAIVGWIARGHFGTASSKLNKLIQEYDRLIAEADTIMSQRLSNDPRYRAWRQDVGQVRNTALTTVTTSTTDQLVELAKLGIFAYIGLKVWQAIKKKGG